MWWLVGLLAAVAAASSNRCRNSVVTGTSRSFENPSLTLTYRSRAGREFFRFRFVEFGPEIRIYILESPDPQSNTCHVLHDTVGRYICWAGSIGSMPEARAVAAMWAEATLVYQRTGRTF